jgi:hypothetical protein
MLLFPRVLRIGSASIDWTDFRALGRIKITHALDAFVGVDDVDRISLADGTYRALWFTGATANALV